MRELYVFCEGPTEQGFCGQVLEPHLFPAGEGRIHTIKVANNKHHGLVFRGGILKYASLKRDIQNTLKSRRGGQIFFSTLIDLFALPAQFPGKGNHVRDPNNPTPYVLNLEKAFAEDIGDPRFISYIQLHEFETMLFTDPDAFAIAFDNCAKAIDALKQIVASVPSIEHINDGPRTAPSKRIIDLIPEYQGRKVIAGPDIAECSGLSAIRAKCPHMDQWVTRLEALPWEQV